MTDFDPTFLKEIFDIAANHTGWKRFYVYLPMPIMYVLCWIYQESCRLLGKDSRVNIASLRLSAVMSDFDNTKARTELGWNPRSMEESVKEAAAWFVAHP